MFGRGLVPVVSQTQPRSSLGRWGQDFVGAGLASGEWLLVWPLSPGGICTPRDGLSTWFGDCNPPAEILVP